MRKQIFRQTFLALSVSACLIVPYAQAQTQGTSTPSGSMGTPRTINPSNPNMNQPGSDTRGSISGTGSSTQDRAMKETDRTLNSEIREALNGNSALREASNSVAINTNNGVVTLSGTVATEKEKMDLETELQRIAGVSRVQNELQIAPRPSNSTTSPSNPIR